MGCHIIDPPYTALKLTSPTAIPVEGPGCTKEMFPTWETIHYEFPGTEFTAGKTLMLTLVRRQAAERGPANKPAESLVPLGKDQHLPENGSIFIGESGSILLPHVGGPQLLPREKFLDYKRPKLPGHDHYVQWVNACLGKGQSLGRLRFLRAVDRDGPAWACWPRGIPARSCNGTRPISALPICRRPTSTCGWRIARVGKWTDDITNSANWRRWSRPCCGPSRPWHGPPPGGSRRAGRVVLAAGAGRGSVPGLSLRQRQHDAAGERRPADLADAGLLRLPGLFRFGPLPVQGVFGHRAAALAAGDLAHAAGDRLDFLGVPRRRGLRPRAWVGMGITLAGVLWVVLDAARATGTLIRGSSCGTGCCWPWWPRWCRRPERSWRKKAR